MPNETPEEFRRRIGDADNKFYDQVAKRGDTYRTRAFEYEKLAVEFANKGFQSLTYLNGGALVAIPTAMAFFKADFGIIGILWTAAAFIIGLLLVVAAQIAAFFTAAKRAESAQFTWSEQWQKIAAPRVWLGLFIGPAYVVRNIVRWANSSLCSQFLLEPVAEHGGC